MLLDECAAAGVRVETGCSIERVRHGDGGAAARCRRRVDRAGFSGMFHLHTTRGAFTRAGAGGRLRRPVDPEHGRQRLRLRTRAPVRPRGAADARRAGAAHAQRQAPGTTGRPQRRRAAGHAPAATARRSFSNYMLVTHRGISGPSILQISSYWQPGDDLRLDLLPGADALETLQRWQRERPAAELKTVLGDAAAQALRAAPVRGVADAATPMKQYNAAASCARSPRRCSLAAGRQRHRGLPHRRGHAGRRRYR